MASQQTGQISAQRRKREGLTHYRAPVLPPPQALPSPRATVCSVIASAAGAMPERHNTCSLILEGFLGLRCHGHPHISEEERKPSQGETRKPWAPALEPGIHHRAPREFCTADAICLPGIPRNNWAWIYSRWSSSRQTWALPVPLWGEGDTPGRKKLLRSAPLGYFRQMAWARWCPRCPHCDRIVF